ncbi:peptide ABC transporter [Enemella dayhoffiae]|uniref:Peptide ABC transporter n=1 Tax=Enemella dayhoffiae TaxID=2016507 RepID=A0A255GL40_9ACTN|nr:ABC transporter permease [Enemella dayhoffiae]OYO16547.1 peptide ABC transporter [Enemella dayhoffiae]
MWWMIGKRLLALIPLLLLTTLAAFALIFLIPGDPASTIAGDQATPERVAQIAAELGLDQPWYVQYGQFVSGLLTGDLGNSFTFNVPVARLLVERLPVTLSLTLMALALAALIGVPLGIIAGRYAGRLPDRVATVLSTLGLATPNFVLGLLLVGFLAMRMRIFPATGYAPLAQGFLPWLQHLLLPGLALAVISGAEIARQLRAGLEDAFKQDYIRTAVAKGSNRHVVTWKHALKNAMLPVVTLMGLQVGYLLGGSAVVESVFGIKGLGDLAVNAVLGRDVPTIQAMVVFTAVITLLCSLLVDLSYGWLDPRIRRS